MPTYPLDDRPICPSCHADAIPVTASICSDCNVRLLKGVDAVQLRARIAIAKAQARRREYLRVEHQSY